MELIYDDGKVSMDMIETALASGGYPVEDVIYPEDPPVTEEESAVDSYFDITHVSVAEAYEMIENNEKMIVIDVRGSDEYCSEAGHIPGAVNYPYNSGILEQRFEELPENSVILVVCGFGKLSNLAAQFLDEKGFTNIFNMRGGMAEWTWEIEACQEPLQYYPLADAGEDQTVEEGTSVQLDASNSFAPYSEIDTFQWTQTAGPLVALADSNTAGPTFTALEVDADGAELVFELRVINSDGLEESDIVVVGILDNGKAVVDEPEEFDNTGGSGDGGGGGCFISISGSWLGSIYNLF